MSEQTAEEFILDKYNLEKFPEGYDIGTYLLFSDALKALEKARQETAKQILEMIKDLDEELDNDEYNRYNHSDFAYKLEAIIKAKFLQELEKK